MSCSKLLPPFTYDVLRYLNRDQLERFSIVCRLLKNVIKRYFHSKPYRVFGELKIRGGLYALHHNNMQWNPNRQDYNVRQFLADRGFCSFIEMRPFLGPTVRIKETTIYIAEGITYSPKFIEQMESIAYLWHDGNIFICPGCGNRIVTEDFQPILNSPTILQCRDLLMDNAHFSFKDYKVLYTVDVIGTSFSGRDEIDHWLQYWRQFLEQPGVKPVVVFLPLRRENIDNLLNQLLTSFSSAVSPNAFKIVFAQHNEPLTEFRETNSTSREKLELKKGLPAEYQMRYLKNFHNYTVERSGI